MKTPFNQGGARTLRGFQRFSDCRVDLEHAVKLGDLHEVENFLLQPDQLHNSAAIAHPALRDEQGTQSTAVAEVNLREIDDKPVEFRTAKDKEFTFQLGGDGGVQLPLFQLENRCGAVLPYLKVHKSSVNSKHCKTIEKVIVDCFCTARGVRPQLEVVENIGKLFCDADTHLRAGFPT